MQGIYLKRSGDSVKTLHSVTQDPNFSLVDLAKSIISEKVENPVFFNKDDKPSQEGYKIYNYDNNPVEVFQVHSYNHFYYGPNYFDETKLFRLDLVNLKNALSSHANRLYSNKIDKLEQEINNIRSAGPFALIDDNAAFPEFIPHYW